MRKILSQKVKQYKIFIVNVIQLACKHFSSHTFPHIFPPPHLSYEVLLFDVTADVANRICGFFQHGQPGLVFILLHSKRASLLAATVTRNCPSPCTFAGLQLWATHLNIWVVVSEEVWTLTVYFTCTCMYPLIYISRYYWNR